ncbi:MAG: hypothetical protein JSW07_17860 [bacterium]|nr:MAG: hypothetical protein JSW07_17860 [bacterium]
MYNWIFIAVIGGLLSVLGLLFLLRCYRQDEITLRYLLAVVVGFISFLAFALVNAFRPELASGPVTIAILLPAFVAILLLIRECRKAKE